MSRNSGKVSKLESLRRSLSMARSGGGGGGQSSTTARPGANNTSPRRLSSSSSSTASPPSSCVSSEGSPDAGSPSMVLSGCPRCMMYVMLSRENPRCPRCHSAVLLDFSTGEQQKHPRKQRR